MIRKILINNRGEIALRVMRTAREMGIRTVAVYSEADADALHTQTADEAVLIGPPEPNQSYLRIDRVIEAARETDADAIHPGYGFLSERAEFVEACNAAGITFIGPPASAMRALGAKIEAKQLAESLGVPTTPGLSKPDATVAELREAALRIGLPVMAKASAGGGGRGMRIIRDVEDLEAQLKIASDEALNAFGDGAMLIEKYVERPRHIEAQIMADQHGNVAPLFERECSIQRRHQKLIEEAGSPLFGPDSALWEAMKQASIKLARAAGYVGAGTIEFMVEPDGSAFYFLELNARLQVEHPVTEGITGLDLVRMQIDVANGVNLAEAYPEWLLGDRRLMRGHALEVRIVAEDPARNFMPSIGKVVGWAEPRAPGVRVDSGFAEGSEVSRFYDSMIAKVITQAPTRKASIEKMIVALQDFHILGVQTNIAYILDVLRHPGFVSGDIDTGFLGREFADWGLDETIPEELNEIHQVVKPASQQLVGSGPVTSTRASELLDGWRIGNRV